MTADPHLIAQLQAHRTVGHAPLAELEWLAEHGTVERFEAGTIVSRAGEPINTGLLIILSGRHSHIVEHGGVWRKVMEWREGDVSGLLPYSRMTSAPGNTVVDELTVALSIAQDLLQQLPVACPTVTAALVHAMLDRARVFKSSDLQVEKMASLGKLAAGLAHELNNPAAAAARSAATLAEVLAESDQAARALGAAGLTDAELATLDGLHRRCLDAAATAVLTPLERADREEALEDWLAAHDASDAPAAALAASGVTPATLDDLASALRGEKLDVALRWVAAGCAVRGLARDIDRAASRIHALVSAVKGFTYMGHATAPEPVDVRRGLTDTLAVLGAKARAKSAALVVDARDDLPMVRGFGGEINQVWMNLIDNALDAIGEAGRVVVTVRPGGDSVVVEVADDGPGIPADLQARVFDPFFTTKPVGSGTGLGLDTARRLVERNDGRMELESRPGRTVFRVTLRQA